MKPIKPHKLALAICIACGVNSAQAAISNGGYIGTALGAGQSGELFLNIWDQAAATSYSLDLGTTVDSFLTSYKSSQTWNLDQRFIDWAALTSDPLTFNVAANNSYGLRPNNINYGVLMSRLTGYTAPGHITNTSLTTGYVSRMQARADALNIPADAQNGGASNTDFAKNLSEVTTTNASSYFGNAFWGKEMGIPGWVGSAVVRNGSVADTTVDLFMIHANGGAAIGSQPAIFTNLKGTLSLDVADAKLIWTAPVPLPGAAWLFMGGLFAALKLQRRKAVSTTV